MRRREFVLALGAAFVLAAIPAMAQSRNMALVGLLDHGSADARRHRDVPAGGAGHVLL